MQNRVFSYLLKLNAGAPVKAFMDAEDHVHRVEGERQDRRRAEQARQVHRVLLVRVDLDAGQPQPAPQRLLPGLRQGPGLSVQFARLHQAPPSSGTGWTRSARRATSCWRSRTTPTSATAGCTRSTSTRPPVGRSTPPGRPRAIATSAWSRSSRARASRRRTRCCRRTTSSPATNCTRRSSAFRPTSAASTGSRAATRARR